MKINLAIYTATEGFDWQPGSVYSRVELNKYKEMIGRFPDILMEDVPYGGIFVCEGRLVFYRFHKAQRWDSRGRDALYCVLGAIPLDAGRKVNLSRVFETREFSAPMRPFPVSIEITESLPIRPPSTWEELEEGLNAASSAAQVGVYATFFGHGKFFCRLDGSGERPALKLAYENCDLKPAPKVVPRLEPVAAPRPSSASCATSAVQAQRERSHAEIEKRLLAQELDKRRIESENQNLKNIIVILGGVIVLAIVVGIGAFMLLRGDSAVQNPERPSGLISGIDRISDEDVVKAVLSNEEKVVKTVLAKSSTTTTNSVSTAVVKKNSPDAKAAPRVVQKAHAGNVGHEPEQGVQRVEDRLPKEKQRVEMPQPPSENTLSDGKERSVQTADKRTMTSRPESGGGKGRQSGEGKMGHSHVVGPLICSQCAGNGVVKAREMCPKCEGKGVIAEGCKCCGGLRYGYLDQWRRFHPHPDGDIYCPMCEGRPLEKRRCDFCGGEGKKMIPKTCPKCKGTGNADGEF